MGACFGAENEKNNPVISKKVGGNEMEQEVDDALGMLNQQFMNVDSLSNDLELHFECSNLPDLDVMSKSDPFVVVYLKDKVKNVWMEKGRTEVVMDNLNPKFVTAITIPYMFEERQPMKLEVYDADNMELLLDLSKQDYIGQAELFVHDVIRAKKQILELDIQTKYKKKHPKIKIIGDQLQGAKSADLVKIDFEIEKCSKKNIFFKLFRAKATDSQEFVPVYQSEIGKKISHQMRTIFKTIQIAAFELIRDEIDRFVQIELFEWRKSGNHHSLGRKAFQFTELTSSPQFDLPHVGTLSFKRVVHEKRNSFLDYIFGGIEIHLVIGVDFTGSNRDPNDPKSLHYFDMSTNQYLNAIESVGSILQCYDTTKMLTSLGFGARLPLFHNIVSHCFAMNGNIFQPQVFGIEGVKDVYQKSLQKVILSGPTNFAPMIKFVADMAQFYVDNNLMRNYFVLMIMTDGLIMDLDQTIDQIVRATNLPISIVIVGVGDEDFSEMEVLDADEKPLSSRLYGQMKRDIVQFVPFNQYKHNPQLLAKETLREIPKQLVDYMTINKIDPIKMGQNYGNYQTQSTLPAAIPTGVSYFEHLKTMTRTQVPSSPDLVEGLLQKGIPVLDTGLFSRCLDPNFVNYMDPINNPPSHF